MTDYVAYYRVSTAKQGRSGLGLAAQSKIISQYLKPCDRIIAQYTDIASGKIDGRSELWRAIHAAKKNHATLLIAKLDRFSRRVSFISGVMDQGVRLEVAELPNASEFQLHIFAALAQEERRLISERTRQALAEARARGTKLGANGVTLAKRNREQANAYCKQVGPFVSELHSELKSYRQVALKLNALGMKGPKGGLFHAEQVKNILLRHTSGRGLSKAAAD